MVCTERKQSGRVQFEAAKISKNIFQMAPHISVTPLGAGQDVGRSCLLVSIGGKHIMLDCGMHMGFMDERRYQRLILKAFKVVQYQNLSISGSRIFHT